MAKEPKSPQEKKAFAYTKDHFTFGRQSSSAFPKVWKRKKTHANREFRRKSDELLLQAKPGIAGDDAILITGELTAAHLQESIVLKSLRKFGVVTVGEKIERKVHKRNDTVGRRVQQRELYDNQAVQAVATLSALEGEQLIDVIQRAGALCQGGDPEEFSRIYRSQELVDRALCFVREIHSGSGYQQDALCRNPGLREDFKAWVEMANRHLNRPKLAEAKKIAEQQSVKRKLVQQRANVTTKLVEGTSAE